MLTMFDQTHLSMWCIILFVLLSCGIEELSLLHAEAKEADVPFGSFLKKVIMRKQ